MAFTLYQYDISLVDQKSNGMGSGDGVLSSGVYVFVYDAGTKTLSTIYSNASKTSKTNPISRSQFATDGKIFFYSESSTHDLFLAHSDGSVARYSSIAPTEHVLKINRDGVDKCLVFPIAASAGGTETDTGLDVPLHCKIVDCAIEVVTVDATETCSLGLLSSETNGDADGLMVAVSVANAGFLQGWTSTTGSNEQYVSATNYGALMGLGKVGTDAANDCGLVGGPGHVVSGANAVSVSYTPSSSDTLAGYGYVWFRHLR